MGNSGWIMQVGHYNFLKISLLWLQDVNWVSSSCGWHTRTESDRWCDLIWPWTLTFCFRMYIACCTFSAPYVHHRAWSSYSLPFRCYSTFHCLSIMRSVTLTLWSHKLTREIRMLRAKFVILWVARDVLSRVKSKHRKDGQVITDDVGHAVRNSACYTECRIIWKRRAKFHWQSARRKCLKFASIDPVMGGTALARNNFYVSAKLTFHSYILCAHVTVTICS